jgi:ribosomal protein S18 acetylase RimI-like enzyme
MFELRDAIVRQVIFAMENQNIRYLMEMSRGQLVRAETIPEDELPESLEVLDPEASYQPLPEWTSADGFQLMEQFVADLHNPVLRDRLQEILVSGKRVFRRFKDALKEHPDAERRFYAFKFLQMRNVVLDWHNMIRELAGLDLVELGADEELDDLVQSNVTILEPRPAPATLIMELDRQGFHEAHAGRPDAVVRYLYRRRKSRLPGPGDARSIIRAAYTPMDDLCGFVWAVTDTLDDGSTIGSLVQVYVLPEYRGLGIGTSLVEGMVAALRRAAPGAVVTELSGNSEPIAALLDRLGFDPMGATLLLTRG